MTNSPHSRDDAALDALIERVRVVRSPTRAELESGLDAVRARVERSNGRRKWATRIALLGALALVPALGFLVARGVAPPLPELSYDVRGGSVLDGGYLQQEGHAGVNVSFSEGSHFVLTPGSRGRLRTVSSERARIGVEHGSALVDITPQTGRLWEVEAGPFVVTVKGTAFTLAWDPVDERLDLRLRHGQVVVSGPISGGELTLLAGQRLSVSLPNATTLISEDRAQQESSEGALLDPAAAVTNAPSPGATTPASAADVQGAAPTSASERPSAEERAAVREPNAAEPKRRWSDELANGRWDVILADAERSGLAATLSTASGEELFALANAARYRQRLELAHDALQALRRRFNGSSRALDAVFLLGRVDEARSQGAQAITWYDAYLAQAPSGGYAAEALGRKLTLVNKTLGSVQARPIAQDYLRRFPEGSYARLARALLDER